MTNLSPAVQYFSISSPHSSKTFGPFAFFSWVQSPSPANAIVLKKVFLASLTLSSTVFVLTHFISDYSPRGTPSYSAWVLISHTRPALHVDTFHMVLELWHPRRGFPLLTFLGLRFSTLATPARWILFSRCPASDSPPETTPLKSQHLELCSGPLRLSLPSTRYLPFIGFQDRAVWKMEEKEKEGKKGEEKESSFILFQMFLPWLYIATA